MGQVKSLPKFDRPREKAKRFGIDKLSDAELLSILIGKGYQGYNAIEISTTLLNKYGGLSNLVDVNTIELKTNKGIKDAKSLILASVFEIHRRLISYKIEVVEESIEEYLIHKYHFELFRFNQEKFILVLLNYHRKIIFEKDLYIGSKNMINISFQDIYRTLLEHKAKSYYIIHNHVDGDPSPSFQDEIATEEIALLSKREGIKLRDHLIIGQNEYYSFQKKKKYHISC